MAFGSHQVTRHACQFAGSKSLRAPRVIISCAAEALSALVGKIFPLSWRRAAGGRGGSEPLRGQPRVKLSNSNESPSMGAQDL